MFKSSSLTNYAPIQNPTFTGKVTLPDGSSITKTTSSYLKQSDAVNTYATKSSVSSVENTLNDTVYNINNTYAPKENPTFTGTVTFPADAISQSAIYWAEENGWFTTTFEAFLAEQVYLDVNKANRFNPTFEGTVTFINTSTTPNTSTTITDYLKSATASSTYLSQTDAASTYAPSVSPTFTGNIVLNGNVTLAQTKANSLTLNDNLSLCTGTNYATPNENNMLGYGITGTIITDTTISYPNIQTNTGLNYSNITLTYGVWLLYGNAGF